MNFLEKLIEQSPLLYVVLPFIIGVFAAEALGNPAVLWRIYALGIVLAFAGAFSLVRQKHNSKYRLTLSVSLYLFLGAFCFALHQPTTVEWPEGSQMWRGIVVRVVERGQTERCTVRLHAQRQGNRWLRLNREVEMVCLKAQTQLRAAEGVLFYGVMRSPHDTGNPDEFDYASYLKRNGISGQIYVSHHWRKLLPETTKRLMADFPLFMCVQLRLLRMRDALVERYGALPIDSDERAVLSALTLGDRQHISTDLKQMYSRVGASHILALSGLHLSILLFFLWALLRPLQKSRVGQLVTTVLLLGWIWLFTCLTGMSVSLMRAATMCTLFLLLRLQHRLGSGLNSVALAALLLLLLNPDALFDVGFQLSFLSVSAILSFRQPYERVRPKGYFGGVAADFVYVAVVAQCATAPLVAYYFHVFPTYFLLSNAIAIPCAYILLCGACLFLLSGLFSAVQGAVAEALAYTLNFMDGGLRAVSTLPHAAIMLYPTKTEVVLLYVLVILLILYLTERRTKCLFSILIVAAVLIGTNLYQMRPNRMRPQIVFFNKPRSSMIQFIVSADQSWLLMSPTKDSVTAYAYLKRSFWDCHAMSEPKKFFESCHDKALVCNENIVCFRGKRIVVVSDDRWSKRVAQRPLPVDYLCVCRGFRGKLSSLSSVFKPSVVVLDGSLYPKQRERLKSEIRQQGWMCHDMAERGALIAFTR